MSASPPIASETQHRGGTIDVTPPLPPHVQQSWNLIGFDADRYDPIVEAPEG